jgi:vacuolar-type H+-ATPase subunit H
MNQQQARRLSRNETHDLSMIIKERTKVLRAYAEEQAAKCLADFEGKVSKIYQYDQDEVWKRATEEAMEVVKKSQEKIEERCRKLGIPKDLSPQLQLGWEGRGQMKAAARRAELRRVAKSEIDAMLKAAIVKIEKQALDLRTQVVAMGLLTSEATLFLESLAPVEDAMQAIDFAQIETKMLEQKQANKRLGYGGLY